MRYFFILLIIIQLICRNAEKKNEKYNFKLPEKDLLNEVLKAVIITDSLDTNKTFSEKLKHYNRNYKYKIIHNPTFPVAPPPADFMSFELFTDIMNRDIGTKTILKDSLFLNYQIDSSKAALLSPSYFKSVKNIKNLNEEEGYYRFYLPLFTSDMKYVYVMYDQWSSGRFVILKRNNETWIKIASGYTWLCACP